MILDQKIKRVVFEITFNRLIHNQNKSPERAARNILDALQLLSVESYSEPDLESIRLELIHRLQSIESPDLILDWLLTLFKLFP